ncbi:MAG TPA: DUF6632 domain-containing protein [Chitinophagaceae bacterium]|jgi:uncharacterized protein DUF6632|nr:DUF6632 domain-containing protein [Chitinophagaceae bacterium]
MERALNLKSLRIFLSIFGIISIMLFGTLFLLTSMDAPVMQEGGALRFLRWDILSKHVELMIEIVYLVWGVFMLLAARRPLSYLSFLNFTLWANLAHGLLMIPQAFMVGMMYKMVTDVAYCLVLAIGLWILLPGGVEVTTRNA